MHAENFPEFIRQKSASTLSVVLNVTESTIYTWAHRGGIPRSRWPELMIAYPEIGLRDLLAMEAQTVG